jgi:hypothetical protein
MIKYLRLWWHVRKMIPAIPKVPLGIQANCLPQYVPRMGNVPQRSGYRTIPERDDPYFPDNDVMHGVLDHGDYRVFAGVWKGLVQQVTYDVPMISMPPEATIEQEFVRYHCKNCTEVTKTQHYVVYQCADRSIVMRKEAELASMATGMGMVAALLQENQPLIPAPLSVPHLKMEVPSVRLSFFTKELHDQASSADLAKESMHQFMSRFGQPYSLRKETE